MSKRTAEILLYGTIGYDWWSGGGITANSFEKEISALEKDDDVDEIHIRINSPGGSVFEGTAIYNRIARSKKTVHTFNDGIAYSMGAIVLLAGKKVFAAKMSTTLLHCCSGGAWGNVRDLKQAIEMMEKLDKTLASAIAQKTGLSLKEVEDKWMNYDDHTLTAEEAIEAKLIDELLDYNASVPANLKAMSTEQIFQHYSNMSREKEKKGFLESIVSAITEKLTPQNKNTQNKVEMDFKNSLDILAKENPSAEELKKVTDEIKSFTGDNEKKTKAEFDAAVKAEKDKADKLQEELINAQAKVKELSGAANPPGKPIAGKEEKPLDRKGNDGTKEFRCAVDDELAELLGK